MKRLLLIFFLIIEMFNGNAQSPTGVPLTYTEVINLDSTLTKSEIYLRARTWFATTFNSSQDVIQMEDKENGRIIGKGNVHYSSSYYLLSDATKGWIKYTITIEVKDGKYRYSISDFIHEGDPFNPGELYFFGQLTIDEFCPERNLKYTTKKWRDKVWLEIKSVADANAKSLISSLKESMIKPSNINGNDKW